MCVDLLEYLRLNLSVLLGTNKPKLPPKPKDPANLIDFDDPPPAPVVKESASQIPLAQRVEMVWKALDNVLLNHPGIEILLIGNFNVIFDYLRLNHIPKVQVLTLQVISKAANNKECVSDIASTIQFPIFFNLLVRVPAVNDSILKTLIAISSNGNAVKALLEYGGLLYFLHILFKDETKNDTTRVLTAELLAKLQSDKLTGPRWTRFLNMYLPPVFADSIRDSTIET